MRVVLTYQHSDPTKHIERDEVLSGRRRRRQRGSTVVGVVVACRGGAGLQIHDAPGEARRAEAEGGEQGRAEAVLPRAGEGRAWRKKGLAACGARTSGSRDEGRS